MMRVAGVVGVCVLFALPALTLLGDQPSETQAVETQDAPRAAEAPGVLQPTLAPRQCGMAGGGCCAKPQAASDQPAAVSCPGHGPGHHGHGHRHRHHGGGQPADVQTPEQDPAAPAEPPVATADFRDNIHALLADHAKISRTVEDIDGGIRSVTTSEDPAIAALIQTHVAQMKQRYAEGMPVRRWDPLFAALFAHRDAIDLQVKNLDAGVEVLATSADPAVVPLIRQHAHRGVSEFVARGFDRARQPTPLPDAPQP